MYILNGHINNDHAADALLKNGSFLYGDGFFETMRYENGRLLFASFHYERWVNTCQVLKISNPFLSETGFSECVLLLAKEGPAFQRVRIHGWREVAGPYVPDTGKVHYLVTAQPLEESYTWPSEGLHLDFYDDHLKPMTPLSNIKSASGQLYTLAALHARENRLDDVVISNTENRPAETSRSNLFIVKQGEVYTPSLAEGCLDGVMRKVVMHLCRQHRMPVHEQPLGFAELMQDADEIFTTNAIRGIQPIRQMATKTMGDTPITAKIFQWLQAYISQ